MTATAERIKDESAVPPYTLPPLLVSASGEAISRPQEWMARRPELLKLFEQNIYGKTLLGKPEAMRCVELESKPDARGGKATRLRIHVLFEGASTGRKMEILLYLPNDVSGPVPVFLGLNFDGNYTTTDDPDLPVPSHYAMGLFENKLPDHKPTGAGRGMHRHMWQVDELLQDGFGLATVGYGEIEPDENNRWREGVRGLAAEPGDGDWGAIGAWAWGLSRAMDYLETHERVDKSRVIVTGFSRLGKAALWAGAQDERFAAVVSNGSGAGGLALSKRLFGEVVEDLTTRFPHWFAQNFSQYAGREDSLPVDQHMLAALIAPRPLLGTSGTTDLWSDPRGEFLSLINAAPVYALLGKKAMATDASPMAGELLNERPAYFLRGGGHDVTLQDWLAMMAFAKKHLQAPGPPAQAAERFARRVASLPEKESVEWNDWFKKSDAWAAKQAAALAEEVRRAGKDAPQKAPKGESFEVDGEFSPGAYRDLEAGKLISTILSYQLPAGGWSKSVDYAQGPRPPGTQWTAQNAPDHYAGTFDNHSTTAQLTFLAHALQARPMPEMKAALERGIDYLLASQIPSGGWPQCYPLEGGYHDNITLNDGAMLHVLAVLQKVMALEDGFAFLDEPRRAQCQAAYEKGVATLLRLQLVVQGQPAIWAAQYDPLTLLPTAARAYEPAALSGGESVSVIRFLFSVRPASPQIRAAITASMAWFAAHPLEESKEKSGEPLWARFYDLNTAQPLFPGKTDGRCWPTLDQMLMANPEGYDFTTDKARDLPKYHEKWLKALKNERSN